MPATPFDLIRLYGTDIHVVEREIILDTKSRTKLPSVNARASPCLVRVYSLTQSYACYARTLSFLQTAFFWGCLLVVQRKMNQKNAQKASKI